MHTLAYDGLRLNHVKDLIFYSLCMTVCARFCLASICVCQLLANKGWQPHYSMSVDSVRVCCWEQRLVSLQRKIEQFEV